MRRHVRTWTYTNLHIEREREREREENWLKKPTKTQASNKGSPVQLQSHVF